MDSRADAQEVGKHLLGHHVVGQRVVVRRLLRGVTGPTGGPAFSDTLGACLAWTDEACVVQTATGDQVSIPIADIVSGKPVPPRPSVRHRVSSRAAERHAVVLYPAVERVALGEWEMRSDPAPAGRPLKRANSCLALGDPGTSYVEAIAGVRRFYDLRSRPPIVQVEQDSAAEGEFRRAGWVVLDGGDSHFQLTSLALAARALRPASRSSFEELLPGSGPVSVELAVHGPRAGIELHTGAGLVARAGAGISGDWLGIHAFEVDPAYRRRGLAVRMLCELLEWGGEQGATTIWLHVEAGNAAARGLYEGLGFVTHHSLRYLTPG